VRYRQVPPAPGSSGLFGIRDDARMAAPELQWLSDSAGVNIDL
jgi:hypothetical protein